MRKRISATALAVALALLVSVSYAAANGDGSNGGRHNAPEFSTLLDVSGNTDSQYFKSYAFAENGKDALTWKEIRPADLTIGLEWDVSKLIKKPGRLILSSFAASGNTVKSAGNCVNAEDGPVTYAIYTITAIAPNPSAIGGGRIVYTGSEAYVDIGAGNEWSKDGYTWKPANGNGPNGLDTDKWCSAGLSMQKQTIFVRGQAEAGNADDITLPSLKSVKVTIPAMPKAPKVRIYASEALLSGKAGLEISNDGQTWARMTGNTLPLGAVTTLPAAVSGNPAVAIDLRDKNDVYVRAPAGDGKPYSDIFETHIRISDTGAAGAEDFTAAPKQMILVDDGVVIEAVIDGKWKKIKKIAAEDIPAAGLKVRRAGTKERLPGPECILRLVTDGGTKTISVTEAVQ